MIRAIVAGAAGRMGGRIIHMIRQSSDVELAAAFERRDHPSVGSDVGQLAGLGMSVLALGQNIGMLAGPVIFGRLAESFGWQAAGYLLMPVCAIGVVAVCLAKFR